jgi:hypothetical protein
MEYSLPVEARQLLAWVLFLLVASAAATEFVAPLLLADPVDTNLFGMVDRRQHSRRMMPGQSWTTRQGVEIHINELGFRTRVAHGTIPAKSAQRIRIAVLGDSETFCMALPYDDCLPGRLQLVLNEKFPDTSFEVLSFAIPGANTLDQMRWLQQIVIPLEPDLVVLHYVLNDIELFDVGSSVDLGHWYDRSFVVRYVRYSLFQRETNELRREKARVYKRWNDTADQTIWADYLASLYASGSLWNWMRTTLREMNSSCERAEIEFLVTTIAALAAWPDFRLESNPYRDSFAVLRSIRDDGIAFIDPLPAYGGAGLSLEEIVVSPTDYHHNAAGNRLLVDYIVEQPEFTQRIQRIRAASPASIAMESRSLAATAQRVTPRETQ